MQPVRQNFKYKLILREESVNNRAQISLAKLLLSANWVLVSPRPNQIN